MWLDYDALFEFAPATLHYQFEVILMLSVNQMQICTGLNSLNPFHNESKSSCYLCYGIFSFIVLIPDVSDPTPVDQGSNPDIGKFY